MAVPVLPQGLRYRYQLPRLLQRLLEHGLKAVGIVRLTGPVAHVQHLRKEAHRIAASSFPVLTRLTDTSDYAVLWTVS